MIVVDDFKTGTMERMCLGYEELKKVKPDIIYAASQASVRQYPTQAAQASDPSPVP